MKVLHRVGLLGTAIIVFFFFFPKGFSHSVCTFFSALVLPTIVAGNMCDFTQSFTATSTASN